MRPTPIPNTLWLCPWFLLGIHQPTRRPLPLNQEDFNALVKAGFDAFGYLDFTRDVLDNLSGDTVGLHSHGRPLSVHYWRLREDERGLPTFAALRVALDSIDEVISTGSRFYLHGTLGARRSALVAASWLIRHGTEVEAAVRRVNRIYGPGVLGSTEVIFLRFAQLG